MKTWVKQYKSIVVIYVTIFIATYIAFGIIFRVGVCTSGSMEPTIMTHDIIIYNRLQYMFSKPARGDSISMRSGDKLYGKRIIGIAGDFITFHDGYVYINGEKLEEDYLPEDVESNCSKTFIVPENKVFVLGDNREVSSDSRFWEEPYVDVGAVKGKMLFVIPMHIFYD